LSDPPLADADPSRIFLDGKGKEENQNGPDETETEAETEKPPPRRSASFRKSFPPEFEAFWADYPSDPIMSKSRALLRWECLSLEDRDRARASLPAFRQHCARNPTYRPVHAERFLSQRRFDGLLAPPREVPPDVEAARAAWGGAAAPLVDEIGAASFNAYFGTADFDPGPPARIAIARPHLRGLIQTKHTSALRRALGDFELVEKLAKPPPMSLPASGQRQRSATGHPCAPGARSAGADPVDLRQEAHAASLGEQQVVHAVRPP
jgi:hypothetical protein